MHSVLKYLQSNGFMMAQDVLVSLVVCFLNVSVKEEETQWDKSNNSPNQEIGFITFRSSMSCLGLSALHYKGTQKET